MRRVSFVMKGGVVYKAPQVDWLRRGTQKMGKLQAVMLGLVGVLALGYAGKSVLSGAINAGGKSRNFSVTFTDNPGLFVFTTGIIAAMGIGALVIAWRALSHKGDG